MQALYKSLDMNVHFIQEAGYLTDSKHTFVVLLDMCSLVQYIKNGNGVLLSVRPLHPLHLCSISPNCLYRSEMVRYFIIGLYNDWVEYSVL